jgi:hypothetical protein
MPEGTGLETAWHSKTAGTEFGRQLTNSIRNQATFKTGRILLAAALVESGDDHWHPRRRSIQERVLAGDPNGSREACHHGFKIIPPAHENATGARACWWPRDFGTRAGLSTWRPKTGRSHTTVAIFLPVPQVKPPKRLDVARDVERALGCLPGLIVTNRVEGR